MRGHRQHPGGEHSYSNTNYLVAGLLIEKTDTDFAPDGSEPVTGFAAALPEGITEGVSYRSVETAAGAGTIVSTAPDLATFFTAAREGTLLPGDGWEEMTDFRWSEDARYGRGLLEVTIAGRTVIGHSGYIHGYYSLATVLPDSGELLVAL